MLMEFCILVNICNILGPVVQSIVSLTSSLMTNSLTVVAIFKATHIFFFSKNLHISGADEHTNVFVIFQDRKINVTLAVNFVKF